MKIKYALILCGGKGTRLGKITKKTPKPLAKFGKKIFLESIISQLVNLDLEKIFLLCRYKKEKIFDLYNSKKINNTYLYCIDEKKYLGTGGAIKNILKKLDNKFLVLNGDSFFNISIKKFLKQDLKKHSLIKIALTNNSSYKSNKKLANLKLGKGRKIFIEEGGRLMNAGIYLLKKKSLKIKEKIFSLETDIVEKYIIKNKVEGFFQNAKFIDIGTIKNYNFLKKNYKKILK